MYIQELLHYKRDELKKLWLDGVEQKQILELLNQIGKIYSQSLILPLICSLPAPKLHLLRVLP